MPCKIFWPRRHLAYLAVDHVTTGLRRLSGMYYKGEGVEKNEKEALKWCRKAAEQGNAGV